MTYVNPWADGIKPNGADIDAIKTVADGLETDLDNETDGLGALKILIDNIKTVVDGIQTDLGNATDGLGALKTDIGSISSGTVFTNFEYYEDIAASAFYIPAATKIVTSVLLNVADKLELYHSGNLLRKPESGEKGFIGMINCDGTDVKFKNSNPGNAPLTVYGFTTS